MNDDVLRIACKPIKDLTVEDIRALKLEYVRLYQRPVPKRPSTTFLAGNVAWGLQAKALGKDPLKWRATLFKQLKQLKQPKSKLQVGAQLIREWHGNTYKVTVTQDGYEYNQTTYKSLTPISRLITGTHISGPRFFGLTKSHAKT